MAVNDLPPGFVLEEPAAVSALPQGFKLDEVDNDALVKNYLEKEEKYGSVGQQALTAVEGAASSATFGLSTGLETALGVDPEDIKQRRETNPWAYGAGQVAGLLVPGGLAGKAIGAAGKGAAQLAGGALGKSVASRIASSGAALATEGAVFQAGDEISKMFVDPDRTLGAAMGDIGTAALFGGGLGVAVGSVSPLWNATVGGKISKAIDDYKRGTADPSLEAAVGLAPGDEGILAGLKQQKANAKEIAAAAEEIGAPVLESQLSASKHIQKIDSMLSQSPSFIGVSRQHLIKEGFEAAENAVKSSMGDAPLMSELEKGNFLRKSISGKLEAEYKPISDLYEIVRQSTPHIPVPPASLKSVGRNILQLEEVALSKSGPGASVAKRVVEDLPGLTSVDHIKRYKTMLYDSLAPGASRAEKNVVNAIAEKLTNLEKNTVVRQAELLAAETADPLVKQSILDLLATRKAADTGYRALMEKVGSLSEMLGKKRVRGFSAFQEFLEEGISAEKISARLFAKGNAEALQAFSKAFPEEAKFLFDQQKAVIRDAAMEGGLIRVNKVLKKVDDLPKEVQEMMFSPEELKRLKATQTYLEAMPKNINPSGTSVMEQYASFYSSPTGATIVTLRDFGINKIMKSLVKKGEEEAFFKSVFPTVAKQVAEGETSPSALKAAVDYGLSVVRGERKLYKSTRAVFSSSRDGLPTKSKETSENDREKLDKRLKKIQKNPEELLTSAGEIGHYLPEHATKVAETATRAVSYLNSLRPDVERALPLDIKAEPDPIKQAGFERALDIANAPLIVLEDVKDGTVTVQDLMTLQNVAPGLYAQMREKLMEEITSRSPDEEPIPYKTRLGLALFLGQPLDSTMTPESIQAAQPKPPMMPAQNQGVKPTATGMQKLSKVGPSNASLSQQREMSRVKQLS